MRAMQLERAPGLLAERDLPVPVPGPGEVLLRVLACGVCRTDLHIADGELKAKRTPIVPGHEIVGRVEACGPGARRFAPGTRVGVPWLGRTCGACPHCLAGDENLCDSPAFTGLDRDGGFAEHAVADERYCLALPARYADVQAAPLLCAGLIGHRAYRMAGSGKRLGLYGFGAAAHLLAQLASWEGRELYAFTRPGDQASQELALRLGCRWAGDSSRPAPVELDAAIIFAPVGALVPGALGAVRKGGVVVCAGIHMSDIPAFPYSLLWGERCVRSVANLTRADGEAFMRVAAEAPLAPVVTPYLLSRANEALADMRSGRMKGAAVLVP